MYVLYPSTLPFIHTCFYLRSLNPILISLTGTPNPKERGGTLH